MRKSGLPGCDSQCHRKRRYYDDGPGNGPGREDAKGHERLHWIEGSSVTDASLDIDEPVVTVKHTPYNENVVEFLSHR